MESLLYSQVEYAIEAINNAGTCVGILAKDGIVMASERRITSGLLAPAKVCTTNYFMGMERFRIGSQSSFLANS
jgi:20S proteasome alpha/beta subunit